mgnify:CR=1 FL=1
MSHNRPNTTLRKRVFKKAFETNACARRNDFLQVRKGKNKAG